MTPPFLPDIAAFPLVPSSTSESEREIAVLRSLGRFEFMQFSWIKALHYPDRAMSTAYYALGRLEENGLVWRVAGPPTVKQKGVVGAPRVYGLTHDGLAYLDTIGAEGDSGTLERMKSRDRKNLKVPRTTLTHDLQAAWWCALLTNSVRRSRRLRDIYIQVEYTTDRQRLDALVILRFWRTVPKVISDTETQWNIPWWNPAGVNPQQTVQVAVALEIDRGTEPLKILLGKGVTYRDLTKAGYYEAQIGVPVTPVFLVPTVKRGAQIMTEWKDAWPDNTGVITTSKSAIHDRWGTLWGQYRRMADGKPTSLLGSLGCPSIDAWEEGWV